MILRSEESRVLVLGYTLQGFVWQQEHDYLMQ